MHSTHGRTEDLEAARDGGDEARVPAQPLRGHELVNGAGRLVRPVAPPKLLHHAVGAPGQLEAEVDAALVRTRLAAVRVEGDAHGGRLRDDGHLLLPALEGEALLLVVPLAAPRRPRPPCQFCYRVRAAQRVDQHV